jgi:hypothetical protein
MNANIVSSPLIEKIAKLLRLSASSNQHESELALSKAKQLAVENDIDLASVSTNTLPEETYDRGTLSFGKRNPITGNFVNWIISSHFNTHIVTSGSREVGRRINFIGKPKDIQISIYVFHFLTQTFMSLWHKYHKDTGCPVTNRGSYFYGLYNGLDQKLKDAQAQAERNKFSELESEQGSKASNGIKDAYAIMVVNNKKKLQTAVEKFYPRLRSTNIIINCSNNDALRQGREDGGKIEITPALGMRQSHLVGA